MGMKKSDRFPSSVPGLPLLGAGNVVGSLDQSPDEWVDPTEVDEGPTSRYTMPFLPPGHDWMVTVEGTFVTVVLRRQHKAVRRESFHFSGDQYVIAAQAVVTAERILNQIGALAHIDLSCLENFTPGVGVVVK